MSLLSPEPLAKVSIISVLINEFGIEFTIYPKGNYLMISPRELQSTLKISEKKLSLTGHTF